MLLFGFSDTESQALVLSSTLDVQQAGLLGIGAGDIETQPLWLEAFIRDACKLVQLAPDAQLDIDVWLDAAQQLDIDPDAWQELIDRLYAHRDVAIGADASILLNLRETIKMMQIQQDASIALPLRADAQRAVQLQSDAQVTLSLPYAHRTLSIDPDAAIDIDVEACDQ